MSQRPAMVMASNPAPGNRHFPDKSWQVSCRLRVFRLEPDTPARPLVITSYIRQCWKSLTAARRYLRKRVIHLSEGSSRAVHHHPLSSCCCWCTMNGPLYEKPKLLRSEVMPRCVQTAGRLDQMTLRRNASIFNQPHCLARTHFGSFMFLRQCLNLLHPAPRLRRAVLISRNDASGLNVTGPHSVSWTVWHLENVLSALPSNSCGRGERLSR